MNVERPEGLLSSQMRTFNRPAIWLQMLHHQSFKAELDARSSLVVPTNWRISRNAISHLKMYSCWWLVFTYMASLLISQNRCIIESKTIPWKIDIKLNRYQCDAFQLSRPVLLKWQKSWIRSEKFCIKKLFFCNATDSADLHK